MNTADDKKDDSWSKSINTIVNLIIVTALIAMVFGFFRCFRGAICTQDILNPSNSMELEFITTKLSRHHDKEITNTQSCIDSN